MQVRLVPTFFVAWANGRSVWQNAFNPVSFRDLLAAFSFRTPLPCGKPPESVILKRHAPRSFNLSIPDGLFPPSVFPARRPGHEYTLVLFRHTMERSYMAAY